MSGPAVYGASQCQTFGGRVVIDQKSTQSCFERLLGSLTTLPRARVSPLSRPTTTPRWTLRKYPRSTTTARARRRTPPQRERASSASSSPRTKRKWARNSSRSTARRARRPRRRKSTRRTNRTRTKRTSSSTTRRAPPPPPPLALVQPARRRRPPLPSRARSVRQRGQSPHRRGARPVSAAPVPHLPRRHPRQLPQKRRAAPLKTRSHQRSLRQQTLRLRLRSQPQLQRRRRCQRVPRLPNAPRANLHQSERMHPTSVRILFSFFLRDVDQKRRQLRRQPSYLRPRIQLHRPRKPAKVKEFPPFSSYILELISPRFTPNDRSRRHRSLLARPRPYRCAHLRTRTRARARARARARIRTARRWRRRSVLVRLRGLRVRTDNDRGHRGRPAPALPSPDETVPGAAAAQDNDRLRTHHPARSHQGQAASLATRPPRDPRHRRRSLVRPLVGGR